MKRQIVLWFIVCLILGCTAHWMTLGQSDISDSTSSFNVKYSNSETDSSSLGDTNHSNPTKIKKAKHDSKAENGDDESEEGEKEEEDEPDLIDFSGIWKIKVEDNYQFANINYDDTGWDELTKKQHRFLRRDSICWIRIHIIVDSAVAWRPIALTVYQFGTAGEFFFDGKKILTNGKVGRNKKEEKAVASFNAKPIILSFNGKKEHLLAVRYSSFNAKRLNKLGINLGMNMRFVTEEASEAVSDLADFSAQEIALFIFTLFATLAFIHLIMYVFYREKIANLYYSIYCFSVFLFTYYIYYCMNHDDLDTIHTFLYIVALMMPLLVVPQVALLHTIFYGRFLKVLYVVAIIFVGGMISIFFYYQFLFLAYTIGALIAYIEIFRVIINAIRKRKEGAFIFAFTILLAPLAGIIISFLPDVITIFGIPVHLTAGRIIPVCILLGLPFAMTLYLARDFALISRQLKRQLNEITDLSARALAQEQEKKHILENQKANLEVMVEQRTQEVILQKNVIENKNREITESLVYAKHIQSAILPDLKTIQQSLPQSFIFYLPKDIVSGDFYEFAICENKIIIAMADCTGHGVAGAFMSMIGSSLFNQIVSEKRISNPAQILNLMNEGVVNALKQRETESHEGMDVALCTFDMQNLKMEFAGANRPLLLVRNGELMVLPANKVPIGGMHVAGHKTFTLHECDLHTGDMIYLFSDGYADQFGGERGKKLMTRKLKEILVEISVLPVMEQQSYLHHKFKDWKGNHEQVDDVLIVGIKIV
ncbi:MAG: SpoIIE family protein phosphatase [Bacteroidetes bacterium]|nr:SpoIIE family protein phosphatase [Bacteroidota bacterium]